MGRRCRRHARALDERLKVLHAIKDAAREPVVGWAVLRRPPFRKAVWGDAEQLGDFLGGKVTSPREFKLFGASHHFGVRHDDVDALARSQTRRTG